MRSIMLWYSSLHSCRRTMASSFAVPMRCHAVSFVFKSLRFFLFVCFPPIPLNHQLLSLTFFPRLFSIRRVVGFLCVRCVFTGRKSLRSSSTFVVSRREYFFISWRSRRKRVNLPRSRQQCDRNSAPATQRLNNFLIKYLCRCEWVCAWRWRLQNWCQAQIVVVDVIRHRKYWIFYCVQHLVFPLCIRLHFPSNRTRTECCFFTSIIETCFCSFDAHPNPRMDSGHSGLTESVLWNTKN